MLRCTASFLENPAMDATSLEDVVRNVDARLTRVEQILPTLATRDELHAAIQEAIAPLATRAELHEAIARLPTREEMHAAIHADSERSHQRWMVLFEDLRDDNRIILDHLLSLSARIDAMTGR